MKIPDVKRDKILEALILFDKSLRMSNEMAGWDKKNNQLYAIDFEGQQYPPKKIISMATGIHVDEFVGGQQSNNYLTKRGFSIVPIERNIVDNALNIEVKSNEVPPMDKIDMPLNQILYGPPGTGKTYATINEALRILDPEFLKDHADKRAELKSRFDSLVAAGHVRFVTFHQSYSYEDFVEGLRADNGENGELRYEVVDGVFKNLCDAATAKITQQAEAPIDLTKRKIWKMSLGNSLGWDAYIYEECILNNYVLLGYGDLIDFASCKNRHQIYDLLVTNDKNITKNSYAVTAVNTFTLKMKVGDIVVVTEGNTKFRAIGEITGDYRCLSDIDQKEFYGQCRDIKWLRVYKPSQPYTQLMYNQFSQMTLYELGTSSINMEALVELLQNKTQISQSITDKVLIIDEINRGNISRIFGELITLIEPSKRAGNNEALEAILPYSKKPFSVPSNVYLIGTMNTADRSLAGLDIALRRRFTFQEMPPKPELLNKVDIDGVNVGELLSKMNERIEVLLDRNHCLGHAYFMTLKNGDSINKLALIFRRQILPLLQEYFYEDWERIAWVFNDHPGKTNALSFIYKASTELASLFAPETANNLQNVDRRWRINENAFNNIECYRGICGGTV